MKNKIGKKKEVKTEYHLIGDKVGSLTKGTSKLFFHYNERDMLVGFEYNKENYFYRRDLTGIINTIVDKNGDVMVEYKYDAWGNWLNQETAAKTSICETLLVLNPFIYKGYIYDGESSLYYLKSRYYSPKIRKFITPDSEIGDVGNIENYNLFAYCINNPVMYLDSDGNFPLLIAGFIVGALVSTAVSIMSQGFTNGWDSINMAQVALDGALGGIGGLLAFTGIGALGSAFISGGLGFVGSVW